jgi:hypothetical protein
MHVQQHIKIFLHAQIFASQKKIYYLSDNLIAFFYAVSGRHDSLQSYSIAQNLET